MAKKKYLRSKPNREFLKEFKNLKLERFFINLTKKNCRKKSWANYLYQATRLNVKTRGD